VKADTVVLAAGGIENARLLLLHERALPASAAMAGRCFMDHPHVLAGTVQFPARTFLDAFLDKGQTLDVLALPDTTQRRESLLNASAQLQPRTPVVPSGGPVEVDLYLRTEQAPNPDSRLVLAERLDPLGCPQPYLHWLPVDEDWNSVVRTAELVAAALAEHHGAVAELSIRSEVPWPWDPAGPDESATATWGNHHVGTTRMAADPAEGVVDRNCLVHGTTNLYVAGSSVFPTGGCANPTFMIVALAHRLVDHLVAFR
jgi:choline dehydrogenase-like flavoprotein